MIIFIKIKKITNNIINFQNIEELKDKEVLK